MNTEVTEANFITLANNMVGSGLLSTGKANYELAKDFAQQEAIAFAEWLIDTFTTDEGRLPLSGNTTLGGRTIFINHTEYPFPHTYNLYKEQSK
jgi:hypothetical protein